MPTMSSSGSKAIMPINPANHEYRIVRRFLGEFPDMQDIASFHRWVHPVNRAERYLVLPDGCRDVLCIRHADGLVQIVSTGFDVRPRLVDLLPGTTITGIGCARARA